MYATIVADAREREGANPYFEAAIAECNRTRLAPSEGGNPIDYLIKTITVGDYAILIRGATGPRVPVLIIERKTWKDLAASIKDKRAKSQHDRMVNLQNRSHCKCLYLIEGMFGYKDTHLVQGLPFKSLHSKIRHNTIRGISFLQSRDQIHSAKIICDLARDMLRMVCAKEILVPGIHEAPLLRQSYESALADLNAKYGIHDENRNLTNELAELTIETPVSAARHTATGGQTESKIADLQDFELLDESVLDDEISNSMPDCEPGNPDRIFLSPMENAINDASQDILTIPTMLTKRNVLGDADILDRLWCSLPGVGEKLAQALRRNCTLRDIINADVDNRAEMIKRLASISYPNGSRLGKPRAEKIMEIAAVEVTPTAMAHVRDLSRKLLEAIPAVSSSTAQIILNHYSLRQICRGEVTEAQIADLKRPGGRRLGVAVAKGVIKYLATGVPDPVA